MVMAATPPPLDHGVLLQVARVVPGVHLALTLLTLVGQAVQVALVQAETSISPEKMEAAAFSGPLLTPNFICLERVEYVVAGERAVPDLLDKGRATLGPTAAVVVAGCRITSLTRARGNLVERAERDRRSFGSSNR